MAAKKLSAKAAQAKREREARRTVMMDFMLEHGAREAIIALGDALRERSKAPSSQHDGNAHPTRLAWASAADEVENAVNLIPAQAEKTITFDEMKRLSFANSKNLPGLVDFGGTRKRWVGIGWVDEGPADGREDARCVP